MKPRALVLSLALLTSALLAPPAGAKCSPGLVRRFGPPVRRAIPVTYPLPR